MFNLKLSDTGMYRQIHIHSLRHILHPEDVKYTPAKDVFLYLAATGLGEEIQKATNTIDRSRSMCY